MILILKVDKADVKVSVACADRFMHLDTLKIITYFVMIRFRHLTACTTNEIRLSAPKLKLEVLINCAWRRKLLFFTSLSSENADDVG